MSVATTYATISPNGLVRYQFDGILRAQAGSEVPAETITGQLTNAQLKEIEAAKLTGTIGETQIANGAISTPKLAAGAVVTASLAAGAVTAEKMTVAELSAITANLGTVTAGTVTGATLRTAAAGARVVMDGTGLRAYNTGGEEVLSFSTATGNLSIKGEIKAGSSVPASTVTGQLTNAQLKEIEAAKLTGTIGETQIGNEAISTPKLKAGAVVTAKVAAGAVTAEKLSVAELSAITANLGTVTAGKISGVEIETLKAFTLEEKNLGEAANTIEWRREGAAKEQIIGAGVVGSIHQIVLRAAGSKTTTELAAWGHDTTEGNAGVSVSFVPGTTTTIINRAAESNFLQLFAAKANRRVAAGRVSSAGALVSGDGFKVERLGTGTYKVTFTGETAIAPAATVTPITTTTAIPMWTVGAISKTSFEVRIWNFLGGASIDCAFSFIAYG